MGRNREGPGSGSIPLTNESGSWRPKNLRIRIPNTAANRTGLFRIRDMLRRRRILGFVHWITDPDPGPALFVFGCQDVKKFVVFFSFLLIIYYRYIYISLQR
jgi:hypothetical protein